MTKTSLPYFDYLLSQIESNNTALETSFGRHVHWGYWPEPRERVGGGEDFARAAERMTEELCAQADLAEGQDVLDVGCGFGGTVAMLNERFERLRLTGLNIDERQLERARRLVSARAQNEVTFVQGDACALPFADASFDRILAVECIFHFPSREAFLREARRVLRPGGILTLSDFVPAPIFVPLCKLSQSTTLKSRINAFGEVKIDATLGTYRRLAAATGFRVSTIRDVTANTLPTYDHLAELLAPELRSSLQDRLFAVILGLQKAVSRSGLLRYRFLSFERADDAA